MRGISADAHEVGVEHIRVVQRSTTQYAVKVRIQCVVVCFDDCQRLNVAWVIPPLRL